VAKQRRSDRSGGAGREPTSPDAEGAGREAVEPELAEALAVGNQAASDRLGSGDEASRAEVRSLADRVATALRVAPRDPAATGRLVGLVGRSALPDHRRALIAMRLEGDQSVADRVSEAVARWLGADDPEGRSALVRAFDQPQTSLPAEGTAPARLSAQVAAELRVDPLRVHGLVQDLALLVAFAWDEEEEELGPPGDYAAEESGF
jgi:hypothetical protein